MDVKNDEDFLSEFKFMPDINFIKCGEIIWNFVNFEINCTQCSSVQTFQTVSSFLNHILSDHLKMINYSFNNFLQNEQTLADTEFKIENENEISLNPLLIAADDKSSILCTENDPIAETMELIKLEENTDNKDFTTTYFTTTRGKRTPTEDAIIEGTDNESDGESKEIKKNKKRIRKKLYSKDNEIRINSKQTSNEFINKKTQQAARPDRMTCEICGKNIRKYAMRKHLKSHDDNRYAHKCPECNKLFVSMKNLDLHRKNVHIADGRQFLCNVDGCNKKCVSEKALKEHTKSHTSLEERPFKCDLCHRRFFYEKKLQQHIRIIHVNGKTFKCDKCDRSYYLEYDLKRHKVVHEEIKPFACDQCPARFVSIHTLARHKKCHSSIKEFCCNICGKQFAIYDYMYAHMKTHGINYSKNYEKTISQNSKLSIE